MDQIKDTNNTFARITTCLDELSDSHGVARCALMYTLIQLVTLLQNEVAGNEKAYRERITQLEKTVDELTKTEPVEYEAIESAAPQA